MAFNVSGATVVAISDARAIIYNTGSAGDQTQASATYLVTGLNSGSNTFTAQYRASSSTCTIAERNIIVTPY